MKEPAQLAKELAEHLNKEQLIIEIEALKDIKKWRNLRSSEKYMLKAYEDRLNEDTTR